MKLWVVRILLLSDNKRNLLNHILVKRGMKFRTKRVTRPLSLFLIGRAVSLAITIGRQKIETLMAVKGIESDYLSRGRIKAISQIVRNTQCVCVIVKV